MPLSNHTSPGRKPLAAVLALVALALGAARGTSLAQLSELDDQMADYLIKDLGYFDTAERFLERLEPEYADSGARADIAYKRLDLLQASGKTNEAVQYAEDLRKRYPKHERSSLSSLPKINVEMGQVLRSLELANASPPERAVELRKEARDAFDEKVEGPLNALIEDLRRKVEDIETRYSRALRDDPEASEPPELGTFRKNRNLVEFARVKTYLAYARALPETDEELRKEREKKLQEGLKYAVSFVEDRTEYPVMRYQAQLERGNYEFELGRYDEAYDSLSLIVDLKPPARRGGSYPPELVQVFRDLHIKGILFGAKAANRGGQYGRAVRMVRENMLKNTGDAFSLHNAYRDESLEKYYVLAQLEYGVGLAGSGDPSAGLEAIQRVIARYNREQATNPVARAYVTDARKALGRVAALGGVSLRGRDYYEGGMGLYSEFRFEEALNLFVSGLYAVSGGGDVSDREAVAPLCLDKIGEINYLLERYAPAAIAYLEICERFAKSELATKAATNALSAASKLTRQVRGHQGYEKLEAAATRFYDQLGGSGLAGLQAQMVEASDLMQQEKYPQAADILKEIPREHKGEVVPFYWLAKARLVECYYQVWARLDEDTRASPEEQAKAQKYLDALEDVRKGAMKEEQVSGAVLASFLRGQIFNLQGNWEGVATALEPFLEVYSGDNTYRPAALYYLIQALARLRRTSELEAAFGVLRRDYPDESATAFASQEVVNHFTSLGTSEGLRKAAEYTLAYLDLPGVLDEVKSDAERLMQVVDILREGGMPDKSNEFLELAAKLATEDGELRKRILFRTAATAFEKKEYREVLKILAEYLKKYRPDGSKEDDPYIYRMVGRSFYELNKKQGTPGQIENLKKAEAFYRRALGIMNSRRLVDPTGKSESAYWRWAYHWLLIKKFLGQAGDTNAWNDIRFFVTENERYDMGGGQLKSAFLKLRAEAESKVKG